jgi:integrase
LKHLHAWLDRPISEFDGAALEKLIEGVKARVPKREGTNPKMPKGAYVANRIIAHMSASWRSLNKKLQGKLGNWNPASAVDKDHYVPKRERIEDLPDWAKRVATMRSPIRRDGLMFTLYTALRHEDVRSVRFDDVDFEASTLRLPDPKGGPDAAFTIPLCASAKLLEGGRAESEP